MSKDRERNGINAVNVRLTAAELKLLTSLASDQLFRREFIDPKMPGYRSNPEEVSLGKSLVARLQTIVVEEPSKDATFPSRTARRVVPAK